MFSESRTLPRAVGAIKSVCGKKTHPVKTVDKIAIAANNDDDSINSNPERNRAGPVGLDWNRGALPASADAICLILNPPPFFPSRLFVVVGFLFLLFHCETADDRDQHDEDCAKRFHNM